MQGSFAQEDLTQEDFVFISVMTALENAQIPQEFQISIRFNLLQQETAQGSDFYNELSFILEQDNILYVLVDKEIPLSETYIPYDLVELKSGSYLVNRAGLSLTRTAEQALEAMAAASRKEGLTLIASSAYRSFANQTQIYERNVRQYGQEATDRVSAKPGHSQHQLGTVLDFGSITNDFAATAQGKWIYANASRFGWSLSYPQGYEHITGYDWESWHYRYVGKELAHFIDTYFGGIQQYALRFIFEFLKS